VLLKVSYDPGWTATVDGRAVHTEMIAPAMVGVPVGPGTHVVGFRFIGFGSYLWLVALGVVALALFGLGPRCARRFNIPGRFASPDPRYRPAYLDVVLDR
jgi:uncharacterized membrane protein YfhO